MIDAHIHFSADLGAAALRAEVRRQGLSAIALLCIPKGGVRPTEPDAFAYAAESEIPVYIFGSLDRSLYALPAAARPEALLADARRLLAMGCTGIKLLEGKPDVHKQHAVPPFDGPDFAPFWAFLEQSRTPVIFHVNDPPEFWHADRLTEFQKKAGWYYDATFPDNETIYAQVFAVLARHPNLRVLFPHFFFMSRALPRLAAILDAYSHVMTDVTPGAELVYNLGADPAAAAFFRRYSRRICYGTDIGARQVIFPEPRALSPEEYASRRRLVQSFLRAQAPFTMEPDDFYLKGRAPAAMLPLCLSEDALHDIFEDNFRRFAAAR